MLEVMATRQAASLQRRAPHQTRRGRSSLVQGLLAYYRLDEATGQMRYDTCSAYHLADVNSAEQIDGAIGKAMRAESTGGRYLALAGGAPGALRGGGNDLTVSTWMRVRGWPGSFSGALGIYNYTTNNRCWGVFLDGGQTKIRFAVSSDGTNAPAEYHVVETAAVSLNQWYHVLCEVDFGNGLIAIAIDSGTPVTAVHIDGAFGASNENLFLGRTGDYASPSDVDLDDTAIWRRLLTQHEKTLLASRKEYPF